MGTWNVSSMNLRKFNTVKNETNQLRHQQSEIDDNWTLSLKIILFSTHEMKKKEYCCFPCWRGYSKA